MTIYPIIEGRHLLLSWVEALFGRTEQQGDVFDHHQRRQRYDESESAGRSNEKIDKTGAPAGVKEFYRTPDCVSSSGNRFPGVEAG